MSKKFTLHLLSDATGDLLYHMAMSILTQFPKGSFDIKRHSFLRTKERLTETLDSIHNGIVCHGIVSEELKELINRTCLEKNIPCSDWIKPPEDFLHSTTQLPLSKNPALLHQMDETYTNKIEALEFTIGHDDSRNLNDLHLADIVLVGISRVSKTPSSIYLSMKGYKVANVSLVNAETIPEQLEQLETKNVIGLTIQPKKLSDIRSRRLGVWGIKEADYIDIRSIIKEVMQAESYYRLRDWPIIDITNYTVEETTTLIINAVEKEG